MRGGSRGGGSYGGRSGGGGYGRASGGRSGGGVSRGGSLGGGRASTPTPRANTPRPTAAPRQTAPRNGGGLGGALGRGVAQGVGFGVGQQVGRNLMGGGRRRGGFGMGGMNNNFGGNQNTNRGSGCSIFIVLVILVIAIIMISSMFGGNGGSNFGGGNFQNVGGISGNQITASTIERTPLPTNSANIVGPWFTDNLGWIQNTTQMEAGLRNFHALTGVRPHVYITDNVNTANFPTTAQVTSFAVELYDELFNDEAHLLLVFFEPLGDNYEIGAAIGNQARSVIDQQALDILFDYIQRYYYIDGLSNEQFFSNAFNSAAERIMYVSHNPWPLVIMVIIGVIGAVLILIILKNWWKKSKAQKNLEAEQTEKILNTPLEGFGSTNSVANDLAKKYEDGDKE